MAKFVKAVVANPALVGKSVNMLSGETKVIMSLRGQYAYSFEDKTTLPARQLRSFNRKLTEVAVEDFEGLKANGLSIDEDDGRGYAVYPRIKFTTELPKTSGKKPSTKPSVKPSTKPSVKPSTKPAPVSHDSPVSHTPKIKPLSITKFDAATGEQLRKAVQKYLKGLLEGSTVTVESSQSDIGGNRLRMVISADLHIKAEYSHETAVADLRRLGWVHDRLLKTLSEESIRELWEGQDVQETLKQLAEEEEQAALEAAKAHESKSKSKRSHSVAVDEEEFDFGDDSETDDFGLDESEEESEDEPESEEADDDFGSLDDLSGDDEIDPDFEESNNDLSGDDNESEDEPESEESEDSGEVYLHVAIDKNDLRHVDSSVAKEHGSEFADMLGIDNEEFFPGLVVRSTRDNDNDAEFVYIGLRLNKGQPTAVLFPAEGSDPDLNPRRVSLDSFANYVAVQVEETLEDDEDEAFASDEFDDE